MLLLLLLLLGLALVTGAVLAVLVVRWARRGRGWAERWAQQKRQVRFSFLPPRAGLPGRTLWHQGPRTAAEKELRLKCFDYGESAERLSFGQPDVVAANTDKVPLLAARWSLDPAGIDERFFEQERGIAGEVSRRY